MSFKLKNYYEDNKVYYKEYAKTYAKDNKESLKEYKKEYYKNNKDKIIKISTQYRKNNIDKVKINHWRRCGITPLNGDFNKLIKMLKETTNCGICGIHKDELKYSLALDHNHDTGEPRGFLCHNCNSAIGKLKDNSDLVRKAAEYLDYFENS